MNYEQFICAILDCTKNKLREKEIVERQEVLKNNGVVMVGLAIREKDKMIAPVIYLEEYYKNYLKGDSVENLSENLIERSRHTPKMIQWNSEQIFNFEQMRDKIMYKLVNTKQNEKMLEQVPNLPILDFSVVFYLQLPISETENGSILIRNSHIDLWKCPISILYQLAKKNTPRICPPVLCPLTEFLEGYGECLDRECPVMVLSNETGLNGAASLLYPEMPEHIYEAIGGNYYLLPSSIHEFLIVPEEDGMLPSELTAIVREVNRTEIAKEEFLSDEVYYFNGNIITKM